MKAKALLFSTAALVAASTLVHAADHTWTGATNTTWDITNTNWNLATTNPWNSTNGGTNKAIFNGATVGTINLGAPVFANALQFDTTGYEIANGGVPANTLTLSGTTPTITTAIGVSATISTGIAGSAGLTKSGAGTLILSGTNSYTGGTVVNGGTLSLTGTATTLTGGISVLGSSTLNINGGTLSTNITNSNAFTVGNGSAGNVTMSSGAVNLTSTGAAGLVVGWTSGAGTWTQTGGTVTLSGNGNIQIGIGQAGDFSISGGSISAVNATLNLGRTAAATLNISGASTTVSVNAFQFGFSGQNGGAGAHILNLNGGTLNSKTGLAYVATAGAYTANLNGGTLQAGTNSFVWNNHANVTATIGASGVTFDSQAFTATTSQILGGTGGLTKIGSGSWTLSGANTYTGGTTVSNGTLSVTGSAMVASGNNGVSIASGATLAVSGTLKLVSNTSQIANSGTFNLSSGTDVLDLNGQITGLTNGSTYNLFSTVGTISGNFNSITGYDTAGFTAALNTANGIITFTAVPEPSTYGLIGAGALAGVAFVRRRRKHTGKVAA